MATTVDDNMLSPEVLTDPYTYFGTLRETEPVHWNDAVQDVDCHPLRRLESG